jgi:hypothetical protein
LSALQSQDTRAGSRASSIHRSFSAYAALRGVRDSALRATVKAVAFVLIARANASGEAWPGYDTIGRDAGVDRRTAISAVAALESAGFIEKVARRTEEGDDDTNLYRLRIGLPARPREESVDAQLVQVEACEPANDVQAPRAAAGPCEPELMMPVSPNDCVMPLNGKHGEYGTISPWGAVLGMMISTSRPVTTSTASLTFWDVSVSSTITAGSTGFVIFVV